MAYLRRCSSMYAAASAHGIDSTLKEPWKPCLWYGQALAYSDERESSSLQRSRIAARSESTRCAATR